MFHSKVQGAVVPRERLHLTSQVVDQTHDNLAENIQSLLQPENLARLETAIKSTYICQIACGSNHALLLTSSGFVYSMGSNEFGQLGNPSDDLPSKTPEARFKNDPFLVFGLMNLKVTDIFAGGDHSLAFARQRDSNQAF